MKKKKQPQTYINLSDFFFLGESGNVGQDNVPAPAWPYTTKVTFQSPFEQVPTVTFGHYLLDSKWKTNLRVYTAVSGLTTTGFQISINTWDDTILYAAGVRWMACGK